MAQISDWIDYKTKISEYKEQITICENDMRETPYYWVYQWVNNNLISYQNSFGDSLSFGQYESKKWLIDKLQMTDLKKYEPLKIDIIGSWFGCPLLELLSENFNISQVDLYDIDENCHRVAAQYINHFDFDFRIVQFNDFFERKELRRRHLIINTSSEHMNDILIMKRYYKNYPDYPILAIQSNNYVSLDDHINCVNSENELKDKNVITRLYYKGTESLPLYDRYMVIGRW